MVQLQRRTAVVERVPEGGKMPMGKPFPSGGGGVRTAPRASRAVTPASGIRAGALNGFQVLRRSCYPVRLVLSSTVLSRVSCYLVRLVLSCVIQFCLQLVYKTRDVHIVSEDRHSLLHMDRGMDKRALETPVVFWQSTIESSLGTLPRPTTVHNDSRNAPLLALT